MAWTKQVWNGWFHGLQLCKQTRAVKVHYYGNEVDIETLSLYMVNLVNCGELGYGEKDRSEINVNVESRNLPSWLKGWSGGWNGT